MIAFIFDLETTGLPSVRNTNYKNLEAYDSARIVSVAWRLLNTETNDELNNEYYIIKPDNFSIPEESTKIHGITSEQALCEGVSLYSVIDKMRIDINKCDVIVAHNIMFDINVLRSELYRMKRYNLISMTFQKRIFCTMIQSIKKGIVKKFSTLTKIYSLLFCDEDVCNAHNAYYDVLYCSKIYKKLLEYNNTLN